MSTIAEKRRALLSICSWDPGYWDKYITDPACSPETARGYIERVKAAEVIFPDEPEPKPQTINIEQRFAEGFQPGKVAEAFARDVERAARLAPGGEGQPLLEDIVQECERRTLRETVREVVNWLELNGKSGAARIVRKRFIREVFP